MQPPQQQLMQAHLLLPAVDLILPRVEIDSIREGGRSMELRRLPTLPAIGAVAALYLLAGKLGLFLAFVQANASPVWPAAAVALASLLVFGYRVWPGIFIAAFVVNVTTAGNVFTSLGIAVGNTLEGLCAA